MSTDWQNIANVIHALRSHLLGVYLPNGNAKAITVCSTLSANTGTTAATLCIADTHKSLPTSLCNNSVKSTVSPNRRKRFLRFFITLYHFYDRLANDMCLWFCRLTGMKTPP